jgi:hypothetical protein
MDRPTLLQVFSPLLSKLNKLECYTDTIRYGNIPDDYYLLNEIEKEVFNYPPKDSILLIENCLSKIEQLKEKGESIINFVSVDDYNIDFGEYLPASEQKTNETKKELFAAVSTELNLFELKLIQLKELLITNQNFGQESVQSRNMLEIDNEEKLPKPISGPNETPLDRYQTALLFHYLIDRKIILQYSASAMGRLVGALTGHSPNTLEKKGFGAIAAIKSDHSEAVNKNESKGIKSYNLKKVKSELTQIIKDIDTEISRQEKLSQKK